MLRSRRCLALALVACSATLPVAVWIGSAGPRAEASALAAHHLPRGFRNLDPDFRHGLSLARVRHFARRLGPMLRGEPAGPPLALGVATADELRVNRERPTVTWIGHSTFLVQLDGVNFLTDPNWSERSGPFGGLVGVSRYTPPGLAFEALPRIDFVVISHDHYDHLDEPTVRRLAATFDPRFIVPLRVKGWLADRGITNAVELDWGASTTVGPLTITSMPVQHFSGRTAVDQGRRLWSSWLVTGSKRFYFAGDAAYSRHFREIGAAYGPIDLAAMPIGSYTPRPTARVVHLSPEEALEAWLELRAARFVAMHWGTFALSEEPSDEPPRLLAVEAARRGIDPAAIWVLPPGETRTW